MKRRADFRSGKARFVAPQSSAKHEFRRQLETQLGRKLSGRQFRRVRKLLARQDRDERRARLAAVKPYDGPPRGKFS